MYKKIILHLALLIGTTAAVGLCIIYPFLPGDYDSLAVTLSTTAQTFGVVGLLLVPVGGLWLLYEVWKQVQSQQNRPLKALRYYFALISMVAASVVAVALAFVAFATGGLSYGVLMLALWLTIVSSLMPKLRSIKRAEGQNFNPTPLYFITVPILIVLFQVNIAKPTTEASRNHAIAMSAEMINDIEAYSLENGHYPVSLLAVWKDYYPSVVGIEKFHYAPQGESYNLFFEQPRFLFDNIGTREFVVYNQRDEHVIISHTSWILILGQEVVESRQGWYEVQDTSAPHWKYFWFD